MTEKSAQRAFHGHLLVDRCLNHIEVSDVLNANPEVAEKIEQAEEIYTTVKNGEATLESVFTSDVPKQLNEQLFRRKQELNARSKTCQLWLKYKSMAEVARALVAADRSVSWLNHLCAVSDCLPIFAVAGHYN